MKKDEHGQYIELHGHKIYAKSDEECAKCDYHICLRVSDGGNILGRSMKDRCCDCKEEIWYDPKLPVGPKRICMQCIIKLGNEQSFPT